MNAGVTDKAPPVVESVEYSSNIVQAKDVITVSVKASDAGSGVSETFATVSFEHKIHREFQNMELAQGAYLKFDKESGKFVGDFRIPVNIPAGDYSGEIDTSKAGLNLFKYTVKGKDGDIYEDFRWVMVNDEYYTVTDGTLFTNQEIEVFVSDETGESIVLTNDGVTPGTEEPCIATLNGAVFRIGETISKAGKYVLEMTDLLVQFLIRTTQLMRVLCLLEGVCLTSQPDQGSLMCAY
ncbi:MAG: hypothetical protein WCR87_06685 [Saccharofermentanales bacterium]